MIILTHSLIEKGTRDKGCDGINRAQCILLGIEWPPRKGWKQALIGTEISEARYEKFFLVRGRKGGANPDLYRDITGQKKKRQPKPKKQKKQKPQPLPAEYHPATKWSEEYYKTPLWARIRELVFIEKGKLCVLCDKPAIVVHHQSYEPAVMRGDDRRELYPLCNECHGNVHFDGTKKRKDWRQYFAGLLKDHEETIAMCFPDKQKSMYRKNRHHVLKELWGDMTPAEEEALLKAMVQQEKERHYQ